ncbi:hypothetical protein OG21DRAFT_1507223 [Imleria badia]|nr:hypothetical protein OG21DRAFT_1507223 [Imleria badia]
MWAAPCACRASTVASQLGLGLVNAQDKLRTCRYRIGYLSYCRNSHIQRMASCTYPAWNRSHFQSFSIRSSGW